MPYSGYVLIRDPQGNPKFDDINNIAQGYWDMLTQSEKDNIIKQRKERK